MSQIKTNNTLDTISLQVNFELIQMRLMPFRFPFPTESLKLAKKDSLKGKIRDFDEIEKDDADEAIENRKKTKE